jgi:dTDP-4-dehydrorhamnose reductase
LKVAICGAGGMLATDVREVFQQRGHEVFDLTINDLDITDITMVREKFSTIKPDVIFNAAAYTNVDGCESEPDLAYKVNSLGPRNLAIAANEAGAALVHISTDYVFGGVGNTPYREYDQTNPQSVYGKSKLDAELFVRNLCPRHYIVRTAWLFGINGNNFVRTMLRLAAERDTLTVVNDQLGSPTFTYDLAIALADLIEKPTYGTYHLTNSGECTWFEFTREILRQAGIEGVEVKPMTTEQLNRPANRPRYSVLDNYVWRMDGRVPLRNYREALADYLQREQQKS